MLEFFLIGNFTAYTRWLFITKHNRTVSFFIESIIENILHILIEQMRSSKKKTSWVISMRNTVWLTKYLDFNSFRLFKEYNSMFNDVIYFSFGETLKGFRKHDSHKNNCSSLTPIFKYTAFPYTLGAPIEVLLQSTATYSNSILKTPKQNQKVSVYQPYKKKKTSLNTGRIEINPPFRCKKTNILFKASTTSIHTHKKPMETGYYVNNR